MHWLIWVGVALVLGLIEILTLTLVLIMLAGGALAAALASALHVGFAGQMITFSVVSVLLLVLLRPWLLRHLKRRVPLAETNTAAHIGRRALVVDRVDEFGGRVKLVGEVWSARTDPGAGPLAVGTEVEVVRIDGATAVVQEIPADHPTLTDSA